MILPKYVKLANLAINSENQLCVLTHRGILPLSSISEFKYFKGGFRELLEMELLDNLQSIVEEQLDTFNDDYFIHDDHQSLLPYNNPRKILGIGLNYRDHASDLDSKSPDTYPVIFMKPENVLIGPGENIKIPKLSERTTGEAELGIIIKSECRNVKPENWLDVVAGFTTILDMTAEDILRQNTRYLGLSKSFDTFLVMGPEIITANEFDDISQIRVQTILNNEIVGDNIVANMSFPPEYLVSFISSVMPLKPGDIISTGTPRAAALSHGDSITCRISGFSDLTCLVIDLKN